MTNIEKAQEYLNTLEAAYLATDILYWDDLQEESYSGVLYRYQ